MTQSTSRLVTTLSLTLAATLCGCGSAADRHPGGTHPTQTGDMTFSFGGDGNPDLEMASIDPGGNNGNDCPDNAKLVYVVDENNVFSSFDAQMLQFHDIGTLDCPAQPGSTPFSMSVDRSGTAWVLYNSGEIFFVDTMTAKCTKTSWQAGAQGFTNFGMGFVADVAGQPDEHLYVANADGLGLGGGGDLGRIDPKTMRLTDLAPLNGNPELTGTGDAKLWGFYPDSNNPRVSQIDKTTAAESNTYALGAQLQGQPLAWAFAFWGGDFYIFLKRDIDNSTNVWHLRSASGKAIEAITDSGRTIVGAGVSTCAPIMIQ